MIAELNSYRRKKGVNWCVNFTSDDVTVATVIKEGEHEKRILLEVEVSPTARNRKRQIASVNVSYDNLKTRKRENLFGSVHANFTQSNDMIEKNTNSKVMIDVIKLIATERNELLLALADPEFECGFGVLRSVNRSLAQRIFLVLCEHVNLRRQDRVLSATRWTNFMLTNLRTLPAELQKFIFDLYQNRELADEFTDNFNYPERQWDCFSSPQRMAAWCDRIKAQATEKSGAVAAAA